MSGRERFDDAAYPGVMLPLPEEICAPVAAGMAAVKRILSESTSAAPLEVSTFLNSSVTGRPLAALHLLSAGMCGYHGPSAITIGVVVELMWAAAELHHTVRKDGPSQFRRATTILAGDWAYLKALRPALELRNFRILDLLIDTSKELVEADLLESGADGDGGNDSRADPHPRWACLFSMSSQLGAVLANVGPIWERQLAEYGFRIAVAWSLKRIMEAPEIPVLRNRAVSEAEVCLQPFPESSHKQSLARLAAYLRSGGASQSPLAASPLRTYSAGL